MSKLITLGRAREIAEKQALAHWDDLVPVESVKFEGLGTVRIGSAEHRVRPAAQRHMATRLGVPLSYLAKCPPDLQAVNLNHWLGRERNEKLFFRFDGDEVRAVFTPRYTPIDNLDVLNRLSALGFGDHKKVQAAIDGEFMMLNLPERERAFDLGGGDEMHPGISIQNSEVGLSSLTVSVFILRLICTNGLIARTADNSSYRHVSSRVMDEFPRVLEGAYNELEAKRRQFALSLESRVDDPEETLRTLNRQFQLSDPETAAVDWAWPMERGNTMFHVVNAYTKAAQRPGLPAESSCRLQRAGGSVLGMLN